MSGCHTIDKKLSKEDQEVIQHVADVLEKSRRFGAAHDWPEGARFIQISETAALDMASKLRKAILP